MRIWGIDYGSKLAGTTSIASALLSEPSKPENPHLLKLGVTLHSTIKKQDADSFILEKAKGLRPELIFLDAPLSLPDAYFGKGSDFFYRAVDRAVGAMSPMFLGGLTARAMKLKSELELVLPEIKIHETYPKLRARDLNLKDNGYKKEKENLDFCLSSLKGEFPEWELERDPTTWHEFDALLALSSALRFVRGSSTAYGEMGDAQIIV